MKPEEVQVGDYVTVTVLKGGYWQGYRRGKFLGWTPKGRAKVETYKGVGCYKPENVEAKPYRGRQFYG